MSQPRLTHSFYARDTITVARDLLGQVLVHTLPDGQRLSGRIVETEAYLGCEDEACHSFGQRRTPRTEVMYGEAGLSYIYFIYGMYFCFNVITVGKDVPEAVLIRALAPLDGLTVMRAQRSPPLRDHHLANGPGKLCRALQLDRRHNGVDLCTSPVLWLERGSGAVTDVDIVDGPRVGIGDRHDAVHWPLRFGLRGDPCLSAPKFPLQPP